MTQKKCQLEVQELIILKSSQSLEIQEMSLSRRDRKVK